MEETIIKSLGSKERIIRCVNWLKEQNDPKKLSRQNKNDIQFIIETNAHRKKFFLTAEDDATVPPGVDEVELEPKVVPLRYLRTERLCLECEWPSCKEFFSDYTVFQAHVARHWTDVTVIEKDGNEEYVCLWDVCGHRTTDKLQMLRHIHYHAYHAKLLAIGFNARATLKLEQCKKDSTKRNQLPPLLGDFCCMWFGCKKFYYSMQAFLDHVKTHVDACMKDERICSWAGCGAKFVLISLLRTHVRVHTGERMIACYHCGTHFALNRKLCDHLLRQNVDPAAGHQCSICGEYFASDYLLREHVRRHVSCYACTLCDMSQPTPADLAHHVRYRHMAGEDARRHMCPHCEYKAVTKSDLRTHLVVHNRKHKSKNSSDESDGEVKKKKVAKKYICHMCPEGKTTIFACGANLTKHLVKTHGAQWPCGHSRFRYQKSEDGMYRLTTTRFEVLEVSKKIVDGYRGPKATLTNKYEFEISKVSECTATTPRKYEISIKNTTTRDDEHEQKQENQSGKNHKDDLRKANRLKESERKTTKRVPKKKTVKNSKKAPRKKINKSDSEEDLAIPHQDCQIKEEVSQSNETEVESELIEFEEDKADVKKEIETLEVYVDESESDSEVKVENNALEIEMCDVDEFGNIINTALIQSKIVYS